MSARPPLILTFLKLEKKAQQKQKNKKPKSKSAKSKKHKSKIEGTKKGVKKESQKGETWEKKWTCPFAFFLHLCCFLDLLLFCFLFFPDKKQKKQNKSKTRKQNKCKENANGQFHVFPFLTFLFFPIYFASVFSVLKFCFLIFHVFSFFCIIFKFKNH